MQYAGGRLSVAAVLLLVLGCSSGDNSSQTASRGSPPAAPTVAPPPPPPSAVTPLAPLPSGTMGTPLTPPPTGMPAPPPAAAVGQAGTPVTPSPSLTAPPAAPGTPATSALATGSPGTAVPGTTPSLGPTAPAAPSAPQPTVPAVQPDSELIRQAQRAFTNGQVQQALDCLRAAAIVRPEGDVLPRFRWSPGLKRPMLLTRWALAFCQVGGKSADDQKKPRGQMGTPIPGNTPKTEADPGMWRPLVSPPLVQKLPERIGAEAFGYWLADLAQKLPPPGATPTQAASPSTPSLGTAVPAAGTAGPSPGTTVPATATVVPPMAAPPTAIAGPTALGPGAAISPMGNPAGTPSGKVGLDLLDATDSKLARQKAASEGIDVLLIAEATVRAARGRTPGQTHLVLRLIDVEANKELWSSPPLSDTRVRTAQKDKTKADPVEELIAGLLSVVDQQLRLVEFPPISAEAAKNRAETLTVRPVDKPLPALMELRYYAEKRLLTPQELSTHYSKLIGPDDGPHLAVDAPPERLLLLRRWLPK